MDRAGRPAMRVGFAVALTCALGAMGCSSDSGQQGPESDTAGAGGSAGAGGAKMDGSAEASQRDGRGDIAVTDAARPVDAGGGADAETGFERQPCMFSPFCGAQAWCNPS